MARARNRIISSLFKSPPPDHSNTDQALATDRNAGVDQVLLSRMRANDVLALDELLNLHARKLGLIAFSIVGSDDLAEEVVHDVFLKLWEHRESTTIDGRLWHYLARATRNQALNIARREKSQWTRADNAGHASYWGDGVSTNEALETLSIEDLRTQVYDALQGVPPRCREIFLMSWEGEMTYAEISSILQISLPTVHNQMSRATQRVAEYLKRNNP